MENYCVFVPCGKRKVNHKAEARNMYIGNYARECYDTANLIYPENHIYIECKVRSIKSDGFNRTI